MSGKTEQTKDNASAPTQEEFEKLLSSIPGFDPKMFGELGGIEDFKGKIEKAGKAWFGREQIKEYAELANWAIRTRFETLSTVSALAATLLIVATFNDKLIVLDNAVRVLLSVLLIITPGSLWGLFYETSKAAGDSFKRMYEIAEQSINKETADKMRALKKPSFRGAIPLIVYTIFTLITFAIIWLIWRG